MKRYSAGPKGMFEVLENDPYVGAWYLAEDTDAEIATLKKMIVSGFYEDEIPTYKQGFPTHELEEAVTAESCTGLVNKIIALKERVWELENKLTAITADKETWIDHAKELEVANTALKEQLENWKQTAGHEADGLEDWKKRAMELEAEVSYMTDLTNAKIEAEEKWSKYEAENTALREALDKAESSFIQLMNDAHDAIDEVNAALGQKVEPLPTTELKPNRPPTFIDEG
jgi:DNA repair exonuclease SbcCD ATPase subunit